MILRPVLASAPTSLPRPARARSARELTRLALSASGRLAGAPFDPGDPGSCALPRDAEGAPLPVSGWWWSCSDTAGMAAGLVAPVPAAIDVEWLGRPRWQAARARFLESRELAPVQAAGWTDERAAVLALWCAKEALLKLRRIGLADLGRCPLVEVRARGLFVLSHRGGEYPVQVSLRGEHALALACDEPFEFACTDLDRADALESRR